MRRLSVAVALPSTPANRSVRAQTSFAVAVASTPMELSRELLKMCENLKPREVYTFHASRRPDLANDVIRVNCDNEYFIEWTVASPRSGQLITFAADYSSIKLMNSFAENVIINDGVCSLRGFSIEFPLNSVREEELCPPPLNTEIPFVSVTREHLRKAFEICATFATTKRTLFYLVRRFASSGFATETVRSPTDKLIIQHGGMRITLGTTLCVESVGDRTELCEAVSTPVEGAYLEFEKGAIDHIVCFLGSLHHQYVKLHIHKDLIFRIVAGEPEGFIKSRTVITFYCGHCA